MDYDVIIFRLIHICFGVFWAGSVIFMSLFLLPTVKAMGPEGGKFMQTLMQTKKFLIWINISAGLTIFAGLYLYDWRTDHFQLSMIANWEMRLFTIGSISAFIGWIVGNMMQKPAANKMAKIGKEIASSGKPPSEEQQKQIGALQSKLFLGANITAWLIGISVVTMSIARYVRF